MRILSGMSVALLFVMTSGTADRSAHRLSDEFWGRTYLRAMEVEHFATPEAMARSADVVAVGRIASVSAGRTLRAAPGTGDEAFAWYANVYVEVADLIKGTWNDERSFEVFFTSAAAREDFIKTPVPKERALLFVRDKAVAATSAGWPSNLAQAEQGFYMLVNMSQGYVRELDGQAHPSFSAESDSFLAGSFDSVVQRVRAAVALGSGLTRRVVLG